MAGWVTAEAGRQPWIVYGLMRTKEGFSQMVSTGDTWFTLLGFMGLYGLLSMLFLFLLQETIKEGPGPVTEFAGGASVSYPGQGA